MIVTTIKASIRMSRQTSKDTWATVELGAEASIPAYQDPKIDPTWQEVQAELYKDLKHQLKTLWNGGLNLVIPPAAPPPKWPRGAAAPAANQETGEITECPEHHRAKGSQHGGLYCPTKLDDDTFCTWTHGKPSKRARREAK